MSFSFHFLCPHPEKPAPSTPTPTPTPELTQSSVPCLHPPASLCVSCTPCMHSVPFEITVLNFSYLLHNVALWSLSHCFANNLSGVRFAGPCGPYVIASPADSGIRIYTLFQVPHFHSLTSQVKILCLQHILFFLFEDLFLQIFRTPEVF